MAGWLVRSFIPRRVLGDVACAAADIDACVFVFLLFGGVVFRICLVGYVGHAVSSVAASSLVNFVYIARERVPTWMRSALCSLEMKCAKSFSLFCFNVGWCCEKCWDHPETCSYFVFAFFRVECILGSATPA